MQDIWQVQAQTPGSVVVVPINLQVDSGYNAIMGAGLALQAATKFPHLKKELGQSLVHDKYPPSTCYWHEYQIITFPTKNLWREPATPELICRSAVELVALLTWVAFRPSDTAKILVPKVGCGEKTGQLAWPSVKPMLEALWLDISPRIQFVE